MEPVDRIRRHIVLLSRDTVSTSILMDLEILDDKMTALTKATDSISAMADMLGVLEPGDNLIDDTLPKLLELAWRYKEQK